LGSGSLNFFDRQGADDVLPDGYQLFEHVLLVDLVLSQHCLELQSLGKQPFKNRWELVEFVRGFADRQGERNRFAAIPWRINKPVAIAAEFLKNAREHSLLVNFGLSHEVMGVTWFFSRRSRIGLRRMSWIFKAASTF